MTQRYCNNVVIIINSAKNETDKKTPCALVLKNVAAKAVRRAIVDIDDNFPCELLRITRDNNRDADTVDRTISGTCSQSSVLKRQS